MKTFGLLLGVFLALLSGPIFSQSSFLDVANSTNVPQINGLGSFGGGVSFVDFNNDGWDDITFCSQAGMPVRYYENNQGTYTEIYLNVPDDLSETKQVNWVDIDNDGDMDLFFTTHNAQSRLFENTGGFNFTDITISSGLNINGIEAWAASWADMNNDGLLDVFICVKDDFGTSYNGLFMNNGGNTFTESFATAIIEDINDISLCAALFDYNNDGWTDIYVSNDRPIYNNLLYRNNGDGTYTDVSAGSGSDISINAMSTTVGDYDNDGWMDIYITNTYEGNSFLRNNGNGTFTDLATANGTLFESIGWGATFLDADNDMHLDLYVSGMIPTFLVDTLSSAFYQNDGTGNYTIPTNAGFDADTAASYSNARGDFNNDGYPDLAVSNDAPDKSFLLQNEGGSNNWLKVKLEGTVSNRNGIGSWIKVYAGGVTQSRYTMCGEGYLGQSSLSNFFGLANETDIDSVEVNWPSGIDETYYNVPANGSITLIEGGGAAIDVFLMPQGSLEFCDGESLAIECGSFVSYQWSNGSTVPVLTVTTSGYYSVTVTNQMGVSGTSDTIYVTVNDLPIETLIPAHISCNSANDGSLNCIVLAGGVCTFDWSNNETTEDIFGLAAGTYDLIVTGFNGCTSTVSATISEPTEIQLVTGSSMENGQSSDGSAWVNVTGGTPPHSFFWNDSQAQTIDSAINLSGGWYSVWIIDANSCMDSAQVFVNSSAGIDESALTSSQVFPNPSNGKFTLQLNNVLIDQSTKVTIYGLDGKMYAETPALESNIDFDLNLDSGIYFLHIHSQHGDFTHKLVIRN